MLPAVIKTCPSADNDFEPLSLYQSQTPDTFYDGKPILHHHDEHVKAWVSADHVDRLFFFSKPAAAGEGHPTPPHSYALENDGGKHVRQEQNVQVFVASNKLTLFSPASGTGLEIPYPTITLHAVKNFRHVEKPDEDSSKFVGVYMQLEFSDSAQDDDEFSDPIELTLIPYKPSDATAIDPINAEKTTALFNQISACSNLNPDPHNEEEDDDQDEADRIIFEGQHEALEGFTGVLQGDAAGGLPPPMPGSSGWITADNVHEYFDEEGNWIGEDGVSGELGEGAGRVRARDEAGEGDANGHEETDDAESKRPRTE